MCLDDLSLNQNQLLEKNSMKRTFDLFYAFKKNSNVQSLNQMTQKTQSLMEDNLENSSKMIVIENNSEQDKQFINSYINENERTKWYQDQIKDLAAQALINSNFSIKQPLSLKPRLGDDETTHGNAEGEKPIKESFSSDRLNTQLSKTFSNKNNDLDRKQFLFSQKKEFDYSTLASKNDTNEILHQWKKERTADYFTKVRSEQRLNKWYIGVELWSQKKPHNFN